MKLPLRKYEIDHLRVFAFAILIFYHVGMFFVPWDFHLKNNEISLGMIYPMLFVNQWRLSLLFLISGIGTLFSLNKRSVGRFLSERFVRLIIPLIFGMLVIVPPQVYFERLAQGVPYGNYFDFYPADVFTGPYPEGNFSWHHLWFLPYLFMFSAILALVKRPLDRFCDFLTKHKVFSSATLTLGLVLVPVLATELFLRHRFPVTHSLADDWYTFVHDLFLFLSGYLFCRSIDQSWPMLRRTRWFTLAAGVSIVGFAVFNMGTFWSQTFAGALLRSLNMWCWIFTILGFSIIYLDKKSRWLSYANQAVYPFYILHQTFIIAFGFYLYDLGWPIWIKFTLMSLGTFAGCWLLYEFFIRRFKPLRILFGMRPTPPGG